MKVALLNDNSHKNHFGCQLVGAAYRQLLAERDIERVGSADSADLVIVNAEGSIHHAKFANLLVVGRYYPSVLLNASLQDTGDIKEDLDAFQIVTARESITAEEYGLELVPDLIFFHKPSRPVPYKDVFITDSSRNDVRPGDVTERVGGDFLGTFGRHKRAVCGRFHAICLAAMLDKPFSAFPANTHKNKGIMHDMGISHLYFENLADARESVPAELAESARVYVTEARRSIHKLFDRIAEL